MKRKQLLALGICVTLTMGTVLTGCGNSNKTESQTTTEASSEESDSEQAEESTGMIESIDTENNTITISEMGQGDGGTAPSGDAGNSNSAPEKPSDSEDGDSSSDTNTPPEKPSDSEDGDSSGDTNTPPDMPSDSENSDAESNSSGDAPSGDMPSGDAPSGDMPSGDATSGSGMGGGNSQTYNVTDDTVITDKDGNTITISDLTEGTFVTYTVEGDNLLTLAVSDGAQGGAPDGQGGAGGSTSSAPTEYTSVTNYTEDTTESSVSQSSTGTDENIAWVSNNATVNLSDITASKVSDDSTGGDNSSFYGVGAAYLVTSGTLNISDSTITTDSAGGAGVFAYGDGVAYVSNTTITTTKNTSGGIHVAGGGTLYATNLTVETSGESSAAIRSDRGSGTMVVDGGTYTSNGTGSPAVYSTADITVSNATLTANNSEAVCIEGKNSLTLTDCDVTSNMPDSDQNDCKWSIILYQSMSGDSEVGSSTFSMTGGSLTSNAGGLFYTTNTSSEFTLEDVDIITSGTPDFFLKCTGNSNARGWGSSGSNGANCTFTAINQEMNGDIIWDSISTLDMSITEGSTLTGAFIDDESNAGNGGDGYANLTIDEDSTWIVTGDSTLTSLNNQGKIVDEDGNTVTIVGSDGTTYVDGNSTVTVTVDSYNA